MIRIAVKRLVRSIYVMRCGYCLVSEADMGSELTYDHFQPQSLGGSDEADNLIYACHACNEFKGDYYSPIDETRLLHPLRDDLTVHLRQGDEGALVGTTAAGIRYIERLQLNRPPLIHYRQAQRRLAQSVARYESIDKRLEQILARIQKVEEQTQSRRPR